MDIGILVFEDAEELDFAGPWEVLGAWAEYFDDGVTIRLVGQTTAPVRCRKGLRVIPDVSLADAEELDLIVVPGGDGSRRAAASQDILNWVRGHAARGSLVTSVCTGALVLASAGLLDGLAATTHWSAYDELRGYGRDIDVRPDERWVDEGQIVTAAGVSAGIDMALHLVARLASPDRAREVRREIQYDPAPPV
jgi:transcriptional regulator GlxA family with amidase domain